MPSISQEKPLALNASTLLRFNPSSGFSGQPGSLEVRLIDSSFGTINDGILTDQSLNSVGGSGSLSKQSVSLLTYVKASEKPPESSFSQPAEILLLMVVAILPVRLFSAHLQRPIPIHQPMSFLSESSNQVTVLPTPLAIELLTSSRLTAISCESVLATALRKQIY